MSSTEKVNYAEFAVIKVKHVFFYIQHSKAKEHDMEKYFKNIIGENFPGTVVKTYTDFEKFCDNVERISAKQQSGTDKRIADFIKIYVM